MAAIIQIDNLRYRPDSYPVERPDILQGISLAIDPGEFIAIIGPNGSGKTTLVKHLNGLLLPTHGHVIVDGHDTLLPENRRIIRQLVGMVFQNPEEQIVASTVEEDIAFGLENLNLSTSEIISRVNEQLAFADLSEDAKRPPHLLSGGQIQKLALAGVLARRPSVILLDEPTSMLDSRTREAFLEKIFQLHQQGLTIIFITHHMEEAVHADRVLIMNQGQILKSGSTTDIFINTNNLHEIGLEKPEVVGLTEEFRTIGWEISQNVLTFDQLSAEMPAFKLSKGFPKHRSEEIPLETKENIVAIKNLHYTYLAGTPLAKHALQGVNLKVAAGGIHAIAGANGSGKSTLLQHLNGILKPSQGSIQVCDFDLTKATISLRDVIREVGLVFQNPESQFFEVFVGDEIAYGPKQFQMEDIRERVRQAMGLVGLDFNAFKDRRLQTLSGGEKRKVAIASTLVLDQQLLLFDEPIAGMDPQSRQELLALINSLNQQGKTVIITSHRLEELARMTRRISIMAQGQVKCTGPTSEVLSDVETLKKSQLSPPLLTRVSHALINKGWPISAKDTMTTEKLLLTLKRLT